jgi:Xaa-Pro aminopeptidase
MIMKYLDKIQEILKSESIDAWMLITQENRDPFFTKFIAPNTSILTVAIVTQDEFHVFAHSLEKELIQHYIDDESCITIYSRLGDNTLMNCLNRFFTKHKNISTIALNYTTMTDVMTDILGHGFYSYFTSNLIDSVTSISLKSFISAEKIIYALIDSKSVDELEKISIAAERALNILMAAFSKVKSGMTELELVEIVHHITEETREDFFKEQKNRITEESYSWEEECCPIVLTGSSFLKGGHALSTDKVIEKGSTVYFDFGVCLTFSDGSKWSSDIQRTGYVLKDGETEPPKEIKQRFRDIIDSISEGINSLKVGMQGFEVDKIVRSYLTMRGYPNYDHATGHAIGQEAHNPGTNFTITDSDTGGLKVQPNGTYTIEPRIPVENGVSIEEMVTVSPDNIVRTLCSRQTDIILIK